MTSVLAADFLVALDLWKSASLACRVLFHTWLTFFCDWGINLSLSIEMGVFLQLKYNI